MLKWTQMLRQTLLKLKWKLTLKLPLQLVMKLGRLPHLLKILKSKIWQHLLKVLKAPKIFMIFLLSPKNLKFCCPLRGIFFHQLFFSQAAPFYCGTNRDGQPLGWYLGGDPPPHLKLLPPLNRNSICYYYYYYFFFWGGDIYVLSIQKVHIESFFIIILIFALCILFP